MIILLSVEEHRRAAPCAGARWIRIDAQNRRAVVKAKGYRGSESTMRRQRGTSPAVAVNIVGIDLSGPSNSRGTCVSVLRGHTDSAEFSEQLPIADDAAILDLVTALSRRGQVVVGLDAPLSYQPGGGLRLRDRSLRDRIVVHGMRHGSVMPPTFNRMAYLTLRGLGVARLLGTLDQEQVRVIEVHPGATFCLRGAPLASVLAFKKRREHRATLLEWLSTQGITSLPGTEPSDHFVAATGAALSAWQWSRGRSVWLAPPEPPFHPFAFAC